MADTATLPDGFVETTGQTDLPDGFVETTGKSDLPSGFVETTGQTPTTATGALARSAATGIAPAFAARGGMWAGARAGAMAGMVAGLGPEDPLSYVLATGGAVVGGLIGGIMGDKAQSALLKTAAPETYDHLAQLQQSDLQNHPIASAVGNLASSLPAFELQNPIETAKGASALAKIATGKAVTDVENKAAITLAGQVGFGTGLGVVSPLIEGQKPTASGVSQSVAQFLLFGEPRSYGGGKGGAPVPPPPDRPADDFLPPAEPVPPAAAGPPPGFVETTPGGGIPIVDANGNPAAITTATGVNLSPGAENPTNPQSGPQPTEAATAPSTGSAIPATPTPPAVLALNDALAVKGPVPVTLLQQAGVTPDQLLNGYQLNAAGHAYEYTDPGEAGKTEDGTEPPSRMVMQTLREMTAAREPVPVSLLQQAQVPPAALANGYQLNAAGTHYEFTEPEVKLTPEQQAGRANATAMADLAARRTAAAAADADAADDGGDESEIGKQKAESRDDLIPVEVSDQEVANMRDTTGTEAAPEPVLDDIEAVTRGPVQFSTDESGDTVKNALDDTLSANGNPTASTTRLKDRISTTTGTPADQVLKGLTEANDKYADWTHDDLLNAIVDAHNRQEAADSDSGARTLAENQKRTQMFEATALQPRGEQAEPMPANQMMAGDTFTLNGHPVQVRSQVMDADTGQPSHLEVTGAYGDQTIPADATVQVDKGSLQARPPATLEEGTPFNMVLASAERSGDKPGLNAKWLAHNVQDLKLPGAPEVRVVQSVSDLPAVHQAKIAELAGKARRVKAMLDDHGTAWLIADHIKDLKEAREAYLEETLGHAGMEPLIKPGEVDGLFDLIWKGAPEQARNIAEVYQHDLTTPQGRLDFVGEFVAKASQWHMDKPTLWRKIADVLRRLASRVGWLRNIAPDQVLDAQMRGLARRGVARLAARKGSNLHRNLQTQNARNEDSTGLKFSLGRLPDEDKDQPQFDAQAKDARDISEGLTAAKQTQPERQFNQQFQSAPDISDASKTAVTNTGYTRRPQETDAAYAQRILQDVGGPDQARRIFNTETRLPQSVRMALGMQILKSFDAAGRHADAADFFDRDFAPHTTDVAQGLAMLNGWNAMSKDGKMFWAQKKISDAAHDALAPLEPDITTAANELRQQNAAGIEHATADPAVQAEAKTAVNEAVANSPETHNGVVMELTQPWASAKVILDMARKQVHAKANELLTKQPRPIGFTASQHLRAIMDDLAKRAADIAAGHYQGAEPGVILRDKLMQRLGLSKDAASRLANALDGEFTRQMKATQNQLNKRIARQNAKQAAGLPVDAEDNDVDRSIRQQLTTAKRTLGTVVRDHWTKADAAKTDLTDKLVKQAGLTGDAAKKLADTIARRLEAMLAKTRQASLQKLLKPIKRAGLAKPGLIDRMLKLTHLGAFDDQKFWNALKERMNLPEWSEELHKKLSKQADDIAKIPDDRVEDQQRAQTEFLNTVERAKGISNMELGLGFFMQNILSGLTTHARVAIHTSAQMMSAISAEMGQALASGRTQDIPLIFEALARGAGKAMHQQKDIMRSGLVVGSKLQKIVPLSVLEQIHFGQKGGTTVRQGRVSKAILESKVAGLLNLWKYNGRLITAQHMLYYKPAEEMKVALLAARQARTEGLTGRAAVDRARQMLGYGAGQVRAAEAQSAREGLTGTRAKMRTAEILQAGVPKEMAENARDYALRQTFLSEPYGFAGAIANVVNSAKQSPNAMLATAAKVIVPFTRIAANLFNEGLNYTPVGAARAKFAKTELLGHKFADITPEVRSDLKKELYAKSALGTMLFTGIAFKAAQGLSQPNPPFTVYGEGPTNPQDKAAWRAAGGIPFTVKTGDHYISYANTPGNVMLGALGNYLDGMRDAALYHRPGAERLAEDLPMRAAASLMGAGKVILEQPFLSSLVGISQTAGEANPEVAARGGIKLAARTASSVVVPNLLRQVDRFYDPTEYDQKDLSGILTSQVPFVRQTGRPMLNALGQPIQSPVFGLFAGQRTPDKLTQLLTDHNAWPATPNPNQTAVNGVPLSADEFYLYNQARGRALAKMLNQPNVKPMLENLAAQTDKINAQAASATNPVAKARLEAIATRLQSGVMSKYTDAANKVAAQVVIQKRGY